MTQRTFQTEAFSVLTGWDRPLQYFFLVISPRQSEDADEPVFSNLFRPNPAMSLEEIAGTLERYGITPPAGLFRDLAEDRALNRGNLEVSYEAPERGATTVAQADERPTAGATVVARIRELADRVRAWISRSQDRGMER
jgi:hypothetical protein